MNAVWLIDYDCRTDKNYYCPCCPECKEPIWKHEDGEYRCPSCGEVISIDEKMQEWFKAREEAKTEYLDCPKITLDNGMSRGCNGKNCVECKYNKRDWTNPNN